MESRNRNEWGLTVALVLLLGLIALVYRPGLDGPFLLDDGGNIGVLQAADFSWAPISYDLTHNDSGLFGRPVSILSLVLTRILHGPDAWGFKFHNLLLHLLNSLLLLWLLLRLLPRLAPALGRDRAMFVAFSTMTLWLAHPLMVSTVLYSVQRMTQLATLFTLGALLAYVKLREAAVAEKLSGFAWSVLLFLGMCVLAVLSKENGALVLVYVVLIEWLVFQGEASTALARKRLLVFHGLFVALPMLLGGFYLAAHFAVFTDYSFRDFTLLERLMTQLHVVLFYVKLVLLPAISDMSLFHDGWSPIRQMDVLTSLLLVFWCGVFVAIVLLRKRAPVLAFGLGWFLVSHLMESTFFALELVFEHRNYLAAAGLLLPPVYYSIRLSQDLRGLLLPLLVLPLFLFMTHARVSEWQSEEMIYSMAVRDHPESIRARVAFAGIEYNRGNLDEALMHVRIAAELDPEGFSPIVINILYLCGRGREEEIAALVNEAERRAGSYPVTPGSITAMDLMLAQIQRNRCTELTPERMIAWLQAAREQEDNKKNDKFSGYLQRQQGFFHYLRGERTLGYQEMINAFDKTGMTSILGEVIEIELRLGSFESAEHLIGILEEENRKRFGTETFLLEKSRRLLQEARRNSETPSN